jgi:hypothetical protein
MSDKATSDKAVEIKTELRHHTGSLERFRHILGGGKVIYTPGVQDMAERCGAWWLVDAIASHIVTNKKLRDDYDLYFWKLTKNKEGSGATLICTNGNTGPDRVVHARKKIEFTDFPLDEIEVWQGSAGQEGVFTLYLPSEH